MRIGLARARFLATGGALFATAAVAAPARAAQFAYKLAHDLPVDSPFHVRTVQMANAVKAQTNGRMEIQVFPNHTLGAQTAELTQLRLGSIQFLITLNAVYSSIVPVSAIDSIGFAFTSPRQPARVLDGPLGAYVRKEFAAKGLYVFEKVFDAGFRQVTSWSKPIRTADDFAGFKIRTPPAGIYVDLFKTIGASPVPIDISELYLALQTHLVDGQETPLSSIETLRYYEVQRYLSVTDHLWTGNWMVANGDAWKALPDDVRTIVERNAEKYTLLERNDMYQLNDSLADKLRRQGLAFNNADVASIRARLTPFYARWKNELGSTAWGLLEVQVGKLA